MMKTIALNGRSKSRKNHAQLHQVVFKNTVNGERERVAFSVDSCKDIKTAKGMVVDWCNKYCTVNQDYDNYKFIF